MTKYNQCYLSSLPKDLLRIIYKYIYNFVPRELNFAVDRYGYPQGRSQNLGILGITGRYNKNILKSSKCKIHNQGKDVRTNQNKWMRGKNKWTNLLANTNNCVCEKLIKSQDHHGLWNKNFKEDHRFSIINGCVFHYVGNQYTGGTNNKSRIIPYFQSDHCWQDLAVRFLRNVRSVKEANEMKECIQKCESHMRELYPQKRDSGCVIS